MLKFSRFASLTSCLTGRGCVVGIGSAVKQVSISQRMAQIAVDTQGLAYTMHSKGMLGTLACTYTQVAHKHTMMCLCLAPEFTQEGTKAGMLSGISQQHNTRSKLYWFTEFCNSQRLSHFAAPFIVVQAETSIAESCGGFNSKSAQALNTQLHTHERQQDQSSRTTLPQFAALEIPHERFRSVTPTSPRTSHSSFSSKHVDARE